MPSSYHGFIVDVVNEVMWSNPKRVLDIGVGFGKWGHLFREYCDVFKGRILKKDWETIIDGVEPYKPNITNSSKFLYNKIYNKTIEKCIDKLKHYDVIYMGDVLEHLTKEDGLIVLSKLKKLSKKLILCVPLGDKWVQGHLSEDDFEVHKAVWEATEFSDATKSKILTPANKPIGLFIYENV